MAFRIIAVIWYLSTVPSLILMLMQNTSFFSILCMTITFLPLIFNVGYFMLTGKKINLMNEFEKELKNDQVK